jgi:hypothetical protein
MAPEPVLLEVADGADQEGEAGVTLPTPLAVNVFGLDSLPRPGVVVEWGVLEGGGSVLPQSGLTDEGGRAETHWTLGSPLGNHSVGATVGGGSVTFHAWATPAPPSDWSEVLELRPGAQPASETLHTDLWVVNHWPGTARLWTPHSCLAEGYPALFATDGERVAGPTTGCWTVPATWPIAAGDSLHAEWDLDIAALTPGQYTLIIGLAVAQINGQPAELAPVEMSVEIGG